MRTKPDFIMWRLEQGSFAGLDIPSEYCQEALQPALYLEDGEPPRALLLDGEDQVIFEKELVGEVSVNGTNLWGNDGSDS